LIGHAMPIAGLAAMSTAASIPPSMPGAAASSGRTAPSQPHGHFAIFLILSHY
jgi:hypothetical protein